MSESHHKKRRSDFNIHGSRSSNSFGNAKKFKTSDRDHFRFSSRRADQWPLFLQKHETELMEEGIAYLLDPAKIAAIKIKTPRPAFRAFIESTPGQEETASEKEERLYQQSFDTAEWKATEEKRAKAEQQLEKDSEKRLAIILRLTDNKINDSIHEFIKTSCEGKSSTEKANAVFNFVSTAHGPHSNLDAQNLRAALWDLDPSELRWTNYLTKFSHYYTMLANMPQLDAEGKPKRGPIPEPQRISLPETTGLSKRHKVLAWEDYQARVEAAQKIIDDKYPDGGPILTFQPTDAELFTLLQQRVKEATAYPSIHNLYAQSLHEKAWTWKDLHREIKLIVENDKSNAFSRDKKGQQYGTRHGKPSGYSRDRDLQQQLTDETADASHSRAQRSSECKNCGRGHPTATCPSPKCYYKGCNKVFDSAETRKAHFISTHGYGSTRGSNRGVSGRGGGRGGGRGSGRAGRGDTTKGRNVSFDPAPSAPTAVEDEIIKEENPKQVNRQATITQANKKGYGFDTTQFDFGY